MMHTLRTCVNPLVQPPEDSRRVGGMRQIATTRGGSFGKPIQTERAATEVQHVVV
jgi:hypothetical protein